MVYGGVWCGGVVVLWCYGGVVCGVWCVVCSVVVLWWCCGGLCDVFVSGVHTSRAARGNDAGLRSTQGDAGLRKLIHLTQQV